MNNMTIRDYEILVEEQRKHIERLKEQIEAMRRSDELNVRYTEWSRMDNDIWQMEDEYLDEWLTYGIPDGADEDEIMETLEDDDEWLEICEMYDRIMSSRVDY